MKNLRPSILLLALAVLGPAVARAQVVADGATATLNNITNNIAGTVTVGTNAPFTQLILTNGAFLTNSGYGVIGRNAGARSNTVRVTSLNTRWLMSSDLIVGSNGAFNRLMVTNGARAENNFGVLGFGPTSSNNEATVIGAGSLWNSRSNVYVGFLGRGNRLVIANGALVVNHSGLLGADVASADNEVVVTDTGSVWSNRGSVFVGFGGHGNRLTVGKGGSVLSTNLVLGSSDATNNRMVVSGTLRATAGGTGVMDIRRGTNEFITGTVQTDFLLMTNPPGKFEFYGGLLITGGARISNSAPFIVGRSGFTPAVWDVRNGPSIDDHLVYGSVIVGSNSSFNQLLVTNGASLFTGGNGEIGVTSAAKSNVVFLSGAFTRWTLETDFHLGVTGAVNRLVVTNGAELHNEVSVIGGNVAATNNEAVVTGPGSLWTNLILFVGASGAGNRLVVTNGAVVASDLAAYVGSAATSTNNRVIVDGGTLRATNSSHGGLFEIRRGTNEFNAGLIETDFLLMTNALGTFEFNGGRLITGGARISNSAPFIVGRSGAVPAVWDVRDGPSIDDHLVYGSVIVGTNSSFNQLLVTNGASLFASGALRIGITSAARSNVVFLSGASTRWNMPQGDLTIGLTGAVNRLVVTNGARMTNESSILGSTAAATNNEAVVTGPGSFWKCLDMIVGGGGADNRVVVTNGGVVTCGLEVTVGSLASSANNRVIVDGGTLRVTNTMGGGLLHVRRGTNVLNAGLMEVDRLLVTNSLGQFEFNGGTLITASTTNSNGHIFFVGNGTNSAILQLAANGIHNFNNSLVIDLNAALTGNGTIIGTVTIYGEVSPGVSIGKLIFNNALFLQSGSQTVMEISKNGSTLTNDQVQINGGVTYSGFLRVTNIGPTALTAGDRFQLFPASSYSGAFAGITLPPLITGLTWTNKLSIDGSIEVLPGPYFASALLSGTNLIVTGTNGPANRTYFVLASTNVALPLTNWTRLLTNQFTPTGSFTFTNPITSGVRQRFYMLQVP